MLSLISLAAAAAVASSPAPMTVAQTDQDARAAALSRLPATQVSIEQGLWEAYRQTPERVVCTSRVMTGSRQAKQTCGSLRKWFDARTNAEMAANRPPALLIEEIKEQRRKALIRGNRGA